MMTHRDLWVALARLIVRHWTGFTDAIQALVIVAVVIWLTKAQYSGMAYRLQTITAPFVVVTALASVASGWTVGSLMATCVRPWLCKVGGVIQSDPRYL
jgi:hypothetical protein